MSARRHLPDETMGDVFRAMRTAKQQRKDEARIDNMRVLNESGVPFREGPDGNTCLFREPGKPQVNFFPSTGRWARCGLHKAQSGGATAFLAWYAKQSAP